MPLDDEKVQRLVGRVESPRRRCKVCKIPMNSDAENRLGVHVRCVYDVSRRQSYAIPGPQYGHRRKES